MHSSKLRVAAILAVLGGLGGLANAAPTTFTVSIGDPITWDMDTDTRATSTWADMASYSGYFLVPIYGEAANTGLSTSTPYRGIYSAYVTISQKAGSVALPVAGDGLPLNETTDPSVYTEFNTAAAPIISMTKLSASHMIVGAAGLQGAQNMGMTFLGSPGLSTSANRKLGLNTPVLLAYELWEKPVGRVAFDTIVSPNSSYVGNVAGDTPVVGNESNASYFASLVGLGADSGGAIVDPAKYNANAQAGLNANIALVGSPTGWQHPAVGGWWNPLSTMTLDGSAAVDVPGGSDIQTWEWTLVDAGGQSRFTFYGENPTITIADLIDHQFNTPPMLQDNGGQYTFGTLSLKVYSGQGADLTIFDSGTSGGTPFLLPEPASMFVLAFGAVAALIRRRRR